MDQIYRWGILLPLLALTLGLHAQSRVTPGLPPSDPPSFWDGSLTVGLARPNWIYYHVTNIPKSAVLYCPEYPALPEGYPAWPKRLSVPIKYQRSGNYWFHDPLVDQQRKLAMEEAARAKESTIARLWRRLNIEFMQMFPPPPRPLPHNFIFLPATDLQFRLSTIMRYMPPDQFWKIASDDIILVRDSDPQNIRQKAILDGRAERKIVLLVGKTAYPDDKETKDFWCAWSVFVPPPGTIMDDLPTGEGTQKTLDELREEARNSTFDESKSDEQSKKTWHVIRQVDLATGNYQDLLVEKNGSLQSTGWKLNRGARFEFWDMHWGTTQWYMVHSWSAIADSLAANQPTPPDAPYEDLKRVQITSTEQDPTVTGQLYGISWNFPAAKDLFLERWDDDGTGYPVSVTQDQIVRPVGGLQVVTSNPYGAEDYALWWRSPTLGWTLISSIQHPTQPLPIVQSDVLSGTTLPIGAAINLNGSHFPEKSYTSISVVQHGEKTLLKEFNQKADWKYQVIPSAEGIYPGKVQIVVEYPAPWTSRSERPGTWKTLLAARYQITLTNE